MRWSDGLQVQPSTIRAQADGILAANSRLAGIRTQLEQLNVGDWQGEAAGNERKTRDRTATAINRQQQQLEPTAGALHVAATSFENIQAGQLRTIEKAHRWGYSIGDNGWVRNEQGLNLDPRRPFVRLDLSASVTALVFRLNSCDVALAAKLLWTDLSGEARDLYDTGRYALSDGIEWLGDKIEDGLTWASDTFEDIRQGVTDFFTDRWDAATTAWDRILERVSNPPEWLRQWREDGTPPHLSQVGGYALSMLGLGVGVAGNAITGRDLHVFDDGRPYVGTVQRAESKPYGGLGDVFETTMSVYERDGDRNSVNVTAVTDENGNVRYIASIPGTAEGTMGAAAWTGAPSGLDWAANFMHIGFGPTSATEAASQAIQDAIAEDLAYRQANGLPVPAGKPELLLTGHSQGGIVAGQLITDDSFLSNVEVKGVVSAGSPQQTLQMNPDVPVYNFQSQYDPIPRADLEGLRINGTTDSPGNITNITMPHSGSGIGDYSPGYTHQQETYLRDIATLNGGNGSPENLQKVQDLHAELGVFFTGETTAYTVEFGREVSP